MFESSLNVLLVQGSQEAADKDVFLDDWLQPKLGPEAFSVADGVASKCIRYVRANISYEQG